MSSAMIRHEEARSLALRCFASYADEFAVIDRATIERPWGWVFFCNTRACVESGDPMDGVVGHGPIFVERETGRVFETGSAHSTEVYLQRFETTGDPHQQLGRVISVDAAKPGAAPLAAASRLHKDLGLPLLAAKRGLDGVLQGKGFEVRTSDPEVAAELCGLLGELGYVARQLPEPA